MTRPDSHAALMRWRKGDLEDLARDNARKLGQTPELGALDKRTLAHLLMAQAKKLSARAGRQGD